MLGGEIVTFHLHSGIVLSYEKKQTLNVHMNERLSWVKRNQTKTECVLCGSIYKDYRRWNQSIITEIRLKGCLKMEWEQVWISKGSEDVWTHLGHLTLGKKGGSGVHLLKLSTNLHVKPSLIATGALCIYYKLVLHCCDPWGLMMCGSKQQNFQILAIGGS